MRTRNFIGFNRYKCNFDSYEVYAYENDFDQTSMAYTEYHHSRMMPFEVIVDKTFANTAHTSAYALDFEIVERAYFAEENYYYY